MIMIRVLAAACAVSIFSLNSALANNPAFTPPNETATGQYAPVSGQDGKDVVWVPTPQALVDRMLDMAQVTTDDYLVDLGSGDGRTVITAAKRGIRAHGIEYNPDLVKLSQEAANKEGVAKKATFEQGDIFKIDFSNATVVTLFLLPSLNERLRPTLLNMKPGTRVVSNSFDMRDWVPDDKIEVSGNCTNWCRAMLWIIPAKVEGNWKMPDGELQLSQKYQMLSGSFIQNGKSYTIEDARMNGAKIVFTANGQNYTGEVGQDGRSMGGKSSQGAAWSATRTAK